MKRLGAGCFGALGGVLAALPPFPGKHRFIDCAAALSRWLPAHGVPADAVCCVTEIVQVEADQLCLTLDGCTPREAFRVETTI